MEENFLGDIEDVSEFQNQLSNHIQSGTHQKKQSNKLKVESKKKSHILSEVAQSSGQQQLAKKIRNQPADYNVFFYTYGCSHNQSDSEFMQGQLQSQGYKLTANYNESDIVVVVSCTVKGPSQQSCINDILRAQKDGKFVVVAGCVPQADRSIEELKNVSTVGIQSIDQIVRVVEQTIKGHIVKHQELNRLPVLNLPKHRKNNLIEILPISGGCLGACTFCKTKHSRGKLISYRPQIIVDRVKQACKEGVKEIWITSEDTGAYGRDIGTNISHLLYRIVEALPKDVMIRLGMTNPPYMWQNIKNMVTILNHPQVYKFLHICVQSGNNEVLQNMNRQYQVEEFVKIVDYLKSNVPGITIATDIICGFPGETDQQFEDTMNLVKAYKFPILNISQFYSRPGTAAAKMKKCNTKDIKSRSQKLTALFDSYDKCSHILGTVQRVLITEVQEKNDVKQLIGHTQQYVKVVLPYDEKLLGQTVLVKVKESKTWHIEGDIVDYQPKPEKIPEDHFKNYQVISNIVTEEEKQEYNLAKATESALSQAHSEKQPSQARAFSFSRLLKENNVLVMSIVLILIGWLVYKYQA